MLMKTNAEMCPTNCSRNTTMNQTIKEIDETIAALERKKTSWASELGSSESGMTAADIQFISAEIETLKTLRIFTLSGLAESRQRIEKYTKDW